jgi:hypothetical protein
MLVSTAAAGGLTAQSYFNYPASTLTFLFFIVNDPYPLIIDFLGG